MKKFIMMLVCTFAMHTMVMADNDKPIQVSQLPAKAQTFIKTYFKDHKVAMAKLESGVFYKSYDVVFTNGWITLSHIHYRHIQFGGFLHPDSLFLHSYG